MCGCEAGAVASALKPGRCSWLRDRVHCGEPSIPDGLAVAIRTGAVLVLHTGDFTMDQLPLDNRITDLRAFSRLGE